MGPFATFSEMKEKFFDSSTLVYICLHLASDSSTFVYIRLWLVCIRLHSSSDSSVFLE